MKGWRRLIRWCWACWLICWLVSGQARADPARVALQVAQGELIGQQRDGVAQFLGVPYAQPPLGAQRWRPPLPAKAWSGTRLATRFGPDCAQGQIGSEDCLYLNIYRPASARNAPIMVWVHGGFFTGGSGRFFDGHALAREYGVVVVTVNYRVGLMGFLAARGVGDGNYGLYDLIQALRWTQANARALGGQPQNLTVFGNSAGAAAICALLTAPAASSLFQKAILQSGNCLSPYLMAPLAAAQRSGQTYVNHFFCPPPVGTCLRSKSLQELRAIPLPSVGLVTPVPLPPVYGEALLPRPPLEVLKAGTWPSIPVLLGTNLSEGRVFEPFLPKVLRYSDLTYPLGLGLFDWHNAPAIAQRYPISPAETALQTISRTFTDRVFACPAFTLARELSRRAPTFVYEFSDPLVQFEYQANQPPARVGAVHGAEIPYVLSSAVGGVGDPQDFSFAQQQLSHQMGAYWTSFARTGQPLALGLTAWSTFTPTAPRVLTLNPGQSAVDENYAVRHQCTFWNELDGREP